MFRRSTVAVTACAVLATTATACSSGFDKSKNGPEQDTGKKQSLRVLIATSGDAETKAVKSATAAWEKKSGHKVTVQIAKDMDQQLAQAFAGNRPPDAFYINSDQFANYAKGGSLHAYGDKIPDAEDFAPELRKAFTYNGELVCLPKDSSTLGLVISTEKWKEAGLTEKDYPTTWDELEKTADKLTEGKTTGLVTTNEYQRLGVFMKQAGGWITDSKESKMTADSKENAEGLGFAKKMLRSGSMKFAKQVDTGWAGEALGKGKAAMIIEGNWLDGAMKADFPDVGYKVLPLPAGPAGKGTLAFSNCWGVAKESTHQTAAIDMIRHLTSKKEQLASSDQIGVMPSRTSVMKTFAKEHPESKGWAEGNSYAQRPVTVPGFTKVLDQFNADLQGLATGSPAEILSTLQRNGEQALKKGD
ncbi:sugar ABC transporter substrate-binding protein [Streptomyces abyssalis]|uniref:Sugar ABC transporter substrate-binding protein n=1 Tax=Streptomyces abyssalis TaxID=933944 RepID=A0A1E7JSV9_9ACTN|nr:extracellular solute-binding protein [Streptomyces abyssalis]OEU91946.1 sugar ABC transporter substrate-binding protein [Streptomyces abyssalis]OEU93911.1 sugar ABC transporter substrate-binding protein [Streptomyces abyssalis]